MVYATCIFCNGALGKNEALEHFPVGRRLAFDAAKGRLWVVCPGCERWNLTPLETRWEAIEEAERAYRGMRLRVSTDNIGLARLSSGLDLVRVGAPPLPEFAAWRYGDQFGRRRRKHFMLVGSGVAAIACVYLAPWVFGLAGVSGLTLGNLSSQVAYKLRRRRDQKRICATVRDDAGEPIRLTAHNIRCAALVHAPNSETGLCLALPHGRAIAVKEQGKIANRRGIAACFERYTEITGLAAIHALSTVLPRLNAHGAKRHHVRDAVDVINVSSGLHRFLQDTAGMPRVKRFGIKEGQTYLAGLPPHLKLALEIMLHQDDEQRLMRGEVSALERRWREADAIATIADSLTLPPSVEERLSALRRT